MPGVIEPPVGTFNFVTGVTVFWTATECSCSTWAFAASVRLTAWFAGVSRPSSGVQLPLALPVLFSRMLSVPPPGFGSGGVGWGRISAPPAKSRGTKNSKIKLASSPAIPVTLPKLPMTVPPGAVVVAVLEPTLVPTTTPRTV